MHKLASWASALGLQAVTPHACEPANCNAEVHLFPAYCTAVGFPVAKPLSWLGQDDSVNCRTATTTDRSQLCRVPGNALMIFTSS